MTDGDNVSIVNDTATVTINSAKITYLLDKSYIVDIGIPVLEDGEEPIRKIMDTKQIQKSVNIHGYLTGTNSTDDLINLFDNFSTSSSDAFTLQWRSLTFDDCWVASIRAIDDMSISGTTASGDSQVFDSDQISDDDITFEVNLTLLRGEKM